MANPSPPLALWGGVECTVNRVQETFFDQLALSGHHDRLAEDLEFFASLGLRTLRTAMNWERFVASGSWEASDRLMGEMRRLSLRPIVGLVHHGSGPVSTDLLDPGFPEKLAAYALQVAERYPDVMDYTPVNEPQTTGRFSCLYAIWYPHHRSMRSYVRALFHQMKGIVLSMQAIRTVQPEARLVHTEDGGETFSTPELEAYRVEREHRRWLGTDWLCGRVDREHAMFGFLIENGLSAGEILWFQENPCPPAVLGLNYYVTSDRFLDHRTQLYPFPTGGDTGDEPLADVEAVRVRPAGISGARTMLRQAWERYGLPLAITEAHLGCDPVEQTRWLAEVWKSAEAARADGVDVRAVTVWSLLGSFNWCHLCAQDTGTYEAGVADLRSSEAKLTPLARLVLRLGQGLPIVGEATRPGWWRRADRLTVASPAERATTEYREELAAR